MGQYTVSFDAKWTQKYYAHRVGYAWIPVWGSFGSRKHATEYAAAMMGLTVAQYRDWKKGARV